MEVRNIKYSYYDRRTGQGLFESTHNGGVVGEYGAYPTIEAMLQSTHPDYCNIKVISYNKY